MSMSGIEVSPDISPLFNEMKLRSTHKYAGFKLSKDKKKVIVDEGLLGDPQATENVEEDGKCFEKLRELVVSNKEPRYLLYDFGFKGPEGRKISKLAFVFWCSDNAPIGLKMVYASTKDTIKKVFTGLSLEFQVNDPEEFNYKDFMEEVVKKA